MASSKRKEVVVDEAEVESEPAEKTIVLKSGDGQEFQVDVALAMGSATIKNYIEDDCAAGITVPLPNVSSAMLAKVIEYWKAHAKYQGVEMERWDAKFMSMGRDDRFDLITAANYLAVQQLLDLLCQTVADTIKNMSVEDVREYFEIENDFTAEEENQLREANMWAFE